MLTADDIDYLKALAQEAGAEILRHYQGAAQVEIKEDDSPVTAADLAANAIIMRGLRARWPKTYIVSEEGAPNDGLMPPDVAGSFWLVDPLDGTKSYIKRTGEFTVNIALIQAGQPVFGVVFVPVQNLLYWTDAQGAAWRKNASDAAEKITVRRPPAAGLTVVASKSHRSKETDEMIAHLKEATGFAVAEFRAASSSLKFCLLAEGAADLYPRLGPTMEWDTGAAHAILRAAGGKLRRPDGTAFTYGNRQQARPYLNPFFIAWGDFELGLEG